MNKLKDQQLVEVIGGSKGGNCAAGIIGGALMGAWGFGWTGPGAIVGAIGGGLIGTSSSCF